MTRLIEFDEFLSRVPPKDVFDIRPVLQRVSNEYIRLELSGRFFEFGPAEKVFSDVAKTVHATHPSIRVPNHRIGATKKDPIKYYENVIDGWKNPNPSSRGRYQAAIAVFYWFFRAVPQSVYFMNLAEQAWPNDSEIFKRFTYAKCAGSIKDTFEEVCARFFSDPDEFESAFRLLWVAKHSDIVSASTAAKRIELHEDVLISHIRPWVRYDVEQELVHLARSLVGKYNEKPTDHVKDTILLEAIKSGIFSESTDQSWFEAGLIAGLQPFRNNNHPDAQLISHHLEIFEEEWFLDPDLADELLTRFEDETYLDTRRNKLIGEGARSRKTRYFFDILKATFQQKPVIDSSLPISIALNHMLACNSHQTTQTLLKIILCKHFLNSGRAQHAASLMLELKHKLNVSDYKYLFDVDYNLINVSFALRNTGLYGTEDVSKKLQIPKFKSSLIENTYSAWTGFDSHKLILEFCSRSGIDVDRNDTNYLQRLTDELGATGPRMIYLHHLENMMRSNNKDDFGAHLSLVIEMLKKFSGVTQSNNPGKPFYITASWLPLTLIHATCHNFGYLDLADKIHQHMSTFEGWDNQKLLISDCEEKKHAGSFSTSIYSVNQARALTMQNKIEEARDLLSRYKHAFKHIRNVPTIAQSAAPVFKKLGAKLSDIDDVLIVSEPGGISHENYIVNYSKL